MSLIHMSFGGPVYKLTAAKQFKFEDHPYCGPIVLGRGDLPADPQPAPSSSFWTHVSAWYQQGKQYNEVGGERFCVYKTQMQAARQACADERARYSE